MATPVLMEVNERDSTLLESFVEEYTRQLNGYAAIGRDILATDHSFITAGGQSQLLLNNDRALKDLLPLDGPEPSIEVCETLYRFTRGAMAKIFLVQVVCSIGVSFLELNRRNTQKVLHFLRISNFFFLLCFRTDSKPDPTALLRVDLGAN